MSAEYNVQIVTYSSNNEIYPIKENVYMNPLVISLYIDEEDYCFYTLYHKDYKVIDINNNNTSTEISNDVKPYSEIYYLEKLCKLLYDNIDYSQLSNNEKEELSKCFDDLRKNPLFSTEFFSLSKN